MQPEQQELSTNPIFLISALEDVGGDVSPLEKYCHVCHGEKNIRELLL